MKAPTGVAAKMLRIMFIVCKKKILYNPEEIKKFFHKDKSGRVRSVNLHKAPYIGDTGN